MKLKAGGRKLSGCALMAINDKGHYRRDVDGLRGLAILCVVLFHATGSLEGGFIGVDVFFVISGYLITGILLREVKTGKLSLAAFWERRVRRIMPASLVMAAVTLGLGLVILLPNDLQGLGKSLVAHVLTVSNFYFWKDSGYFDGASEEKPLLHTWSLAVEEQFYILYPLLFVILGRLMTSRGKSADPARVLLPGFSIAAVAGLLLSVWMVHKEAQMAFYLLPSRFWELLLGGILACFPDKWLRTSGPWSRVGAVVGLALIIGSAVQLRETMPFPGWLALPPCLGGALLIWALAPDQPGTRSFWVRRVLESRVLVGLGLISFSLYLWHWPLLTFWEYMDAGFSRKTDDVVRLLIVLLAVGVSYASWRWVENPFRRPQPGSSRGRVFACALLGVTALVLSGAWVNWSDGFPGRWAPSELKVANAEHEMGVESKEKGDAFVAVKAGRAPSFGSQQAGAPVHVLVWGDSHAWCMSPAVAAAAESHGKAGLLTWYPSTPPGLGFVQPASSGLGSRAVEWGEAILKIVKDQKIPNVVLVGYWRRVAKGRLDELRLSLEQTVKRFREEAGAQVWVVRDVPVHQVMVPRALAFHQRLPWLFPDPALSACTVEEHTRANAPFDALFDALKQSCGLRVLDPAPALAGKDGRYLLAADGASLYGDVGHHLSISGALHVSSVFEPLFESIRPDGPKK